MKTIKQEWNEEWAPEFKNAWHELKNPKTFYKQIPNLLTASRLLSPIIIIPIALTTNVITTFIVAGLFAATDAVDGKLARKLNVKSKLGETLDPFTDKLFAISLLLPNIASFPVLTTLFLTMEAIIARINTKSKLKGNYPKSNMLGKIKTAFLSTTAVGMYLAGFPLINAIVPFLGTATLVLQTGAAALYKKIDIENDRIRTSKMKTDIKTTPILETTKKEQVNKKENIFNFNKQELKEQLIKERESLLEITIDDVKKR